MKKLITPLIMLLTVGMFAAEITIEQMRDEYYTVLTVAQTNSAAAQTTKLLSTLVAHVYKYGSRTNAEFLAFASEVDRLADYGLAAYGQGYNHTATNGMLPRMSLIGFERAGLETNIPYAVSLGRRYGKMCVPWRFAGSRKLDITEYVGLLNECINLSNGNVRNGYSYGMVQELRKRIQERAPRIVKQHLRSSGKTIVSKDGVNPCNALITELNTALHAPYFAGLNEWLAKVGVNSSIDTSNLPSLGEVETLRQDILSAKKDLTKKDMFVLKICLGVDGYNKFVREYNGEG